jgi:acetate kinase
MKILVINCGSSSIKYKLYESKDTQVLAAGIVARIGEDQSYLEHNKEQYAQPLPSHREGFSAIIEILLDKEHGVINEIDEIVAVGHRVVHGGDVFTESTLVTDEVIAKIEECIPLAPLHNPPNLLGIQEAMRLLPDVPHVAVFDTSFHQGMQPKAYLYALPYEHYQESKIRRYGFHGTSFRYVSQHAAQFLGKPLEELKMIICHLGNGASISAVDQGVSVDTSMGMTPLEGLIMGTRSGDVDPGVIFYLNQQLGMDVPEIDRMLNKQSGIKGISGRSNDIRDVLEQAQAGDERCQLTLEMFAYRVKKYIGAYMANLGGLDALVFTAGIGENAPQIRTLICDGLEAMGINLDAGKNQAHSSSVREVSAEASPMSVLVVPTNEEEMIFKDTLDLSAQARRVAS